MSMLFLKRRDDEGFTLVETLAALLVFALMTLGLIPILISSLQGADLSRSITINKNAAVEAMERVRGLPYFVSFGAQGSKADILDLYYPMLAAEAGVPGQSYGSNTFTTECSNATLANPACPRNIPAGTTLRFEAVFVTGAGGTVTPPAGYAWNSTTGTDLPASLLLDMKITALWTQRGRPRSFRLQSLVGDRKFGEIKLRGEANVEFAVQVLTSYANPAGEISELLSLAGMSGADIESRLVSSADISVRAADIRLSKLPTSTNPTATELAAALGAIASHRAPPDKLPPASSALEARVTHPEIADPNDPTKLLAVGGMEATSAEDLRVGVGGEVPTSKGKASFAPGAGSRDFWVQTQVDPVHNTLRKFDSLQPSFSIRGNRLSASSNAVTGALGAVDRRVETVAFMDLTGLRLLPVTFVTEGSAGGALIEVRDFKAETKCVAADNSTTAMASATWSATLRYWADLDPLDGIAAGAYQTVSLSGGAGADPLAAIKQNNPLVLDGALPTDDVYLFEDPANLRTGYLSDWSSLRNVGGSEHPSGRFARAQIAGALKIDTRPTNPTLPESGLNVQVGVLRCEALDQR